MEVKVQTADKAIRAVISYNGRKESLYLLKVGHLIYWAAPMYGFSIAVPGAVPNTFRLMAPEWFWRAGLTLSTSFNEAADAG